MENISINLTDLLTPSYNIIIILGTPTAVFGTLLNLFLAYLLLFERKMRDIAYIFIFTLVISDCVSQITFSLYFIIISVSRLNNQNRTLACRLFFFITISSYSISVISLCFIAFERYLAIMRPMSPLTVKSKCKIAIISTFSTVLFSILMASPLFHYISSPSDIPGFCDLIPSTNSLKIYLLMTTALIYMMPAIILVTLYGKIIFYMKLHIRPEQLPNTRYTDSRLQKRKFIKMMITVGLSYLATTWPFFTVLTGLSITGKNFRQLANENMAIFILALLSFPATMMISIINPCLFLKYDRKLKRSSKLAIQSLCRCFHRY